MRSWIKEGLIKLGGIVVDEAAHQVAQGAHELSAALYSGSAFVMYGRGTRDDPQVNPPQQEQSQDMGRDM